MQQSAKANEYTWTRVPRIDDADIVIDNSGAGSNAVIIWLRMRGPPGIEPRVRDSGPRWPGSRPGDGASL